MGSDAVAHTLVTDIMSISNHDTNGDLLDFFAEDTAHEQRIDDDDVQIGRRITEARVALGDSEDTIAERLGVTPEAVRGWESGAAPLRANHLNRLAGVLGVSLSWLIMGRGPDPLGDTTELERLRTDLSAARSLLDDVVNELAVIDQRLARLDAD